MWQWPPCLLQQPNSTAVISSIIAVGSQTWGLCHLVTP
jgi:hypothetical protein